MIRFEQIGVESFQWLFYKFIPKQTRKNSKFISWLEMAILGRILRLETAIYSDEISIETTNNFIDELKSMSSSFHIRILPFTPRVLLFLFDGKNILIVLPLSENYKSDDEEIKFLEIRNFEIGKILEKMIEIALVESLPFEQ